MKVSLEDIDKAILGCLSNAILSFLRCLFIGVLFYMGSLWLESSFSNDFLKADLLTLFVALLAINTTTLSVLLTRLKEIKEKYKGDFTKTFLAIKCSFWEQVFLITLTALLLMIKGSSHIQSWNIYCQMSIPILLYSSFLYSIHILCDTAIAVFCIFDFEEQ